MTDLEISKLTRKELIEMLLDLTEENDRLKDENDRLAKERNQRKIAVETSGTMAEAALKLNRVFEAADAAAKQYLQNIKARADADREKAQAEAKAEEKTAESTGDNTENADNSEEAKQNSIVDETEAEKGLKKWKKKK